MRTRILIGVLAASLSVSVHAGEGDGDTGRPGFQVAAGAEVTSERSEYVGGGDVVTFLPGVYGLWGRFYVRGPALGAYLLGGGDWTVSTGIALELVDADRGGSPQLADMDELDHVVLGELVATYQSGWGELGLRVAADVSGRHDGYLAGLSWGYPLELGAWTVEPGAGIEWRSAEVNRYFYGVGAADVLPARPRYRPDASVSHEIGVAATYSFAEHHSLQLTAGVELFDSEVSDSPIVARNHRRSVGVGYLFRF